MRYVIHLRFTKFEESLGPESKQADTNANGFVDFIELVGYVRKKVDKETEGDKLHGFLEKNCSGILRLLLY
jgi:hypothetical protein